MTRYIDKDALVAEIESRITTYKHLSDNAINSNMGQFYDGKKAMCNDLLSFLDFLEVKEVDLEKEIEKVKKMYSCLELKEETIIDFCAKHFFELGLGVQLPVFIYKPSPQNLASELSLKTQKGE